MIFGYVRVSTPNQKDGNSIQDQKSKILERYPDAKIVVEVYSGAKERPLFSKMLKQVKQGDTIVTTKLDRFCRSTQDGLDYIADCQSRNVNIHILNMGLIEDSPIGKLIVTQLLAFAEYERAIIKERTAAGKLIAKQKPDYKEGRPKLEVPNFEETKAKVDNNEISLKSALVALDISKSTYYRLARQN